MSGRDERKGLNIPDCPKCQRRPAFWALGTVGDNPLCWLYSREYSLNGERPWPPVGTAVTFSKNDWSVDYIKYDIKYAWCSICGTFYRDKFFLDSLIDVTRQLEKINYVGLQ